MRLTLMGAAFLTVTASAAAVQALDNVALRGSDTLEVVTNQVLNACPGAKGPPGNLTYAGGGSSTGENALIAGTQTVAPMSRFLRNATGVCAKGGTAEGLAIGLDGLVIAAKTSSADACGGGLAFTKTIQVTEPGSCPGCAGTSYTLADWRDVLRVVYGGRHHDAAQTVDCDSGVRKALVNNWGNLFETGCAGGSCTQLKRAFRRSDLSGTTDTFVALLGLPSIPPTRPASGTPPPGAANPFCNANPPTVNTLYAGDADFRDADPIRRPCDATEQVCQSDGTLGLVTVVLVPENAAIQPFIYPTELCSAGRSRLLSPGPGVTRCPNGKNTLFGKCFQPTRESPGGVFTANCVARQSPPIFTQVGDGRAYNLIVKNATGVYQKDGSNRNVTGAFYRLHTTTAAAGSTPCTSTNSTEQIGCLVQASPCSIGFAGREAAPPAQSVVRGLSVRGIAPTNTAIENLVTTPDPSDDYPLARKLYLTTLNGFESTTLDTGEKQLALCMANASIINPIMTANGYLPIPGGVRCEDFNESTCAGAPANANACANNPAGIPTN
jgi:ABC-type phosphate transport system substrate-binding protein